MSDAGSGIDERWLMAAFLALTILFHFLNRKLRDLVDAAIAPLKVPERRPSGYSQADLATFRDVAAQTQADGRSALNLYRGKILTIDLGFAVCLAAFSYIAWDYAAPSQAALNGTIHWLGWLGRLMSLVYGLADVAEDVLLMALLRPQKPVGKRTSLASLCTRGKMISLTCSAFGVLVFLGLALADLLISRFSSFPKKKHA